MSAFDDLDLSCNPYPVCPYCGAEHRDTWEVQFNDNEQELECPKCEKTYLCSEHVSYSYSTKPIDPPQPDERSER